MQPDQPSAICTEDPPTSPASSGSPDTTQQNCTSRRAALALPLARTTHIDAEYTDDGARPRILNGVKMGEGDGTVSLLSLGAMCVEGWKRERWNPAGIKVVTVEVRVFLAESSMSLTCKLFGIA